MNPKEYRLLVSAGPTREWIDPVRFLSNASSGKTGWNIAKRGVGIFRETVYVRGAVDSAYAKVHGVDRTIIVETTAEMKTALLSEIEDDTLLIMSAAPADYYVPLESKEKLKKSNDDLILNLQPTDDILLSLLKIKSSLRNCFFVGFAADTQDGTARAFEKLQRKNLDFICANQVYKTTKGFGENENLWQVLDREGNIEKMGPASKENLAEELLHYLIKNIDTSFIQ